MLRYAFVAIFFAGAALWAMLFFSPEFANSRWPWALNPFDARIMSAWFAGSSVWALTMYFLKDWAEVKVGVRALLFFILGLLAVWALASWRYPLNSTPTAGRQAITYVASLLVIAGWLLYGYWKQERNRR